MIIRVRQIILLMVLLPTLVGMGPWGRLPGGILAGEEVNTPVNDWSFVANHNLCALEVRPAYPHSITVSCWNVGKDLYIGCMNCEGKSWSSIIVKQPRARVRIGDKVYPVLAKGIESREEMQIPWETRWNKSKSDKPVKPVPQGYWLFTFSSPGN